jgi:hypothetical protein
MGVFEAPPPAPAPLLSLVRGPLALLVGVALAAVIGLVRYEREHAPSQPSSVSVPRRAEDEVVPRSPELEPAPAQVTEAAAPNLAARAPERAAAMKPRRAHAAVSHSLSASDTSTPAAPSGEVTAPESGAGVSAAVSSATSATTVAAREGASAPSPARARAEEPREEAARPPAPLDEASLLQRARKLAASDPEAALRFLNEHKLRFAHGMLAPEREVLAIELLRALSRRAEAARRLEEFRRAFPGSVYLQRLER